MQKIKLYAFLLLAAVVAGCSGGGSSGGSITPNAPAPTTAISANPSTVPSGSGTVLTWSSQNATFCNASSGWSGSKATSGSEQIQNLTSTTTFLLECVGPGGSVLGSTTVIISSTPTSYATPFPYVDVLHTRAVFDGTRGLLYAFVPQADADHPNTFAIIDANQRTVTYTSPVDFVPFTMTVSPDGSYLYVGTAFNSEIVRISLPDFSVNLRFSLGSDPNAPFPWPQGQLFEARHIAVSPTDSELFAVSLVDNTYWTCAIGLRVYKNSTQMALIYDQQSYTVGDIVAFGADGSTLTTLCSGTYPDIVSRIMYGSGSLAVAESHRGESGIANVLEVKDNAVLTGTGSKFDMPGFVLRGALPPLTIYNQGDPAPVLDACIFANDAGTTAACLSHTDITDGFPTFRTFVLYELTDATPFLAVPLDRSMSHNSSTIIRTGAGQFVVSVGFSDQNPILLDPNHYMHQNTRIYFLSGINTSYP